ncbi:MAG: arylsulfotransferase family protein, partial [bacterium]
MKDLIVLFHRVPPGGGSTRPAAIAVFALILMMATLLSCGKEGGKVSEEDEIRARLDKMRSLPYTAVTEEKVSGDKSGVVLYDKERSWPGYNLYFDRFQTRAVLFDMNGRTVHQWSDIQTGDHGWQYGIPLDNGDLVTFVGDMETLRLNWNSVVLWKKMRPVHHEVCRMPDGTFYVIGRQVENYRGKVVKFPVMIHIDGDGREIERWSTYDHLDDLKRVLDTRSFLDTVLDKLEEMGLESAAAETLDARSLRLEEMETEVYDYFHMNTTSVLPDSPSGRGDSRFAEGNFLICLRNVNQIAVLYRDNKEILWAWGEGELELPHHPTMLENGNILIFDNGAVRKYSRVIELNPVTEEIEWEYTGDPPETFYSSTRGSAQRFPNGNTLICESNEGRVFEVTPEKEIVWEWYNPHLVEGHRVQLYRLLRYPVEMMDP